MTDWNKGKMRIYLKPTKQWENHCNSAAGCAALVMTDCWLFSLQLDWKSAEGNLRSLWRLVLVPHLLISQPSHLLSNYSVFFMLLQKPVFFLFCPRPTLHFKKEIQLMRMQLLCFQTLICFLPLLCQLHLGAVGVNYARSTNAELKVTVTLCLPRCFSPFFLLTLGSVRPGKDFIN